MELFTLVLAYFIMLSAMITTLVLIVISDWSYPIRILGATAIMLLALIRIIESW